MRKLSIILCLYLASSLAWAQNPTLPTQLREFETAHEWRLQNVCTPRKGEHGGRAAICWNEEMTEYQQTFQKVWLPQVVTLEKQLKPKTVPQLKALQGDVSEPKAVTNLADWLESLK